MKDTLFTNNTDLSTVDLTNTDLLNSAIHINGINNKSNIIHSRLPNGSFYHIDSNDLVHNGGAEKQVIDIS